jgi:tRNA(Ile)-lysidine synthase
MSLHPSVAAVRVAVRRTLAEVVAELVAERRGLPADAAVLVACSGGADSLALLAATVFEGHRLGDTLGRGSAGLRVIGVTVDHGLQDDSAAHTTRVVEQMAALGADETASARVEVSGGGRGPEAAAREARYAVLDQMVQHFGAVGVLLGHTLDDQAETVLLGLARGSGGRSLAGMRRRFDHYHRPLLDVTRADTVTACQVEGIDYWNDPHNDDPAYARVRVRRTVLPVLEDELGPGVSGALARTADQLRADTELLDQLAQQAYEDLLDGGSGDGAEDGAQDGAEHGQALEVTALAALPAAIRSRVLRIAALEAGAPGSELFHVHVVALTRLVSSRVGGSEVQLPGHVTAYLSPGGGRGRLRFRPTAVRG